MSQPRFSEKELMIISAYAQGKSQREIAKYVNISVGNVNRTIVKARKRITDLEELRSFYKDLNKRGLGPLDVEYVVSLLKRLDNLGLTLDQLSQSNDFLEKTGFGEQTLQYITIGVTLQKLEAESDITAQQLLDWYRRIIPQKEAIEKEVTELSNQKEQLKTELPDLNELKKMKDILLDKGITLHKLGAFLDTQLTLEKLGFTKEAANILATELDNTGMSPEAAANRIATYLAEAQSLEEKKSKLTLENDQLQRKNTSLDKDIVEKKKQLSDIKNRIQTKIENEKIIVDKAVQEYVDKAEAKLEPIQAELKNKTDLLKTIENKIMEKGNELKNLETRKEELEDRYIMGEGLIQILRDPASTTLNQLKRLSKSANDAMENREKYPNIAASNALNIKSTIAQILSAYLKRDIVYGGDYRKVLEENRKLKNLTTSLLTKSEEKDQTIKDLSEKLESARNALGIEATRQALSDASDLSTDDLNNIRSLLDQIIRDKSGKRFTVGSEKRLYARLLPTKNVEEWLAKRIGKSSTSP